MLGLPGARNHIRDELDPKLACESTMAKSVILSIGSEGNILEIVRHEGAFTCCFLDAFEILCST